MIRLWGIVGDSSTYIPPTSNTSMNRTNSYTISPRPLRNCQRNATAFNSTIIASIVTLNLLCGPSNIIRSVINITVTSINRMFHRRTWPNNRQYIFFKHFKIIPPRATFYTPRSIVFEGFGFRITTPLFHRLPNTIKRVVFKLIKIFRFILSDLFKIASATNCFFEMRGFNNGHISTGTSTIPSWSSRLHISFSNRYNRKPVKFKSYSVFWFIHNMGYFIGGDTTST